MIKPAIETIKITVPSGIEVEIKTKLSYGDNKAIYTGAFGNLLTDEKIPAITIAQAQELIAAKVFCSLVSWNITDEKEVAIPLTQANMEEIFTEEDVNFLIEKINPDKKKLTESLPKP